MMCDKTLIRLLPIIAAALTVANCGSTSNREAAAAFAATKRAAENAEAECKKQYPRKPPTFAALERCRIAAAEIQSHPNVRWYSVLTTYAIATAEQVDKGQLTLAQYDALMAAKWDELASGIERRLDADRAIAAQEAQAAAQRSQAEAQQRASQIYCQRTNSICW